MRSSYGALEPVRVSLGVTREASRRRWGTVRLTGALAAAAVVVLVALAGPLSFRSSLLDAVSAIGNDAPSSIATYQPTITGIPYGYDPVSGATQFMPIPGPYATGVMPPQTVGPMMFPAPGTGYPGNAYQMPTNGGPLALNTYQPYPYGPLPYGNINPIVPYPQYATAPLTPYGMLQPGPQTTVTITNNKDPVTVTMPQQPDWVNFPAVMLDPAGAPFGSTASTAAAYNSYASSVKPGVTFIPQVNYTFIRNFPIMPNIPPPVDLFTGTGPSGEAPYHIVGSVLSERPKDEDFSKLLKTNKLQITGRADDKPCWTPPLGNKEEYGTDKCPDKPADAMKQLRLQQLFANGVAKEIRDMRKTARLQDASDKAPTMMLMQLKELKKEAAQAAQAGWGTEMLADDVTSHDAAATTAAAGGLPAGLTPGEGPAPSYLSAKAWARGQVKPAGLAPGPWSTSWRAVKDEDRQLGVNTARSTTPDMPVADLF